MIELLCSNAKTLFHTIMQKSHRANYHGLLGPSSELSQIIWTILFIQLRFRRYLKIGIMGEVFVSTGKSFHTLVPPYNTDCWGVVKCSYQGSKIFLVS